MHPEKKEMKRVELHLKELIRKRLGHDTYFKWLMLEQPKVGMGKPDPKRKRHPVCVAYTLEDADDGLHKSTTFAYAFCAPTDQFTKGKGRVVALRKLYTRLKLAGDLDLKDPRGLVGAKVLDDENINDKLRAVFTVLVLGRQIDLPRWW